MPRFEVTVSPSPVIYIVDAASEEAAQDSALLAYECSVAFGDASLHGEDAEPIGVVIASATDSKLLDDGSSLGEEFAQ